MRAMKSPDRSEPSRGESSRTAPTQRRSLLPPKETPAKNDCADAAGSARANAAPSASAAGIVRGMGWAPAMFAKDAKITARKSVDRMTNLGADVAGAAASLWPHY